MKRKVNHEPLFILGIAIFFALGMVATGLLA